MALITEIVKTIACPVQELVFWLSETYQVDTQETFNKWYELTGINIQVVNKDDSDECGEPIQVVKATKSTKIPKVKNACCLHVFTNGSRAGEQCSTKPKNGAEYCSAHRPKPKKSSDDETPKKPKQSKKKVDDIYASDVEVGETKKPKQSKKKNVDDSEEETDKAKKQPKKKNEDSSKKVEDFSKKVEDDDVPLDIEESAKSKSKKVEKKPKKESKKKKVVSASEIDESEPESRVKPLLKKKGDDEKDIVDDELDF